MERRGGVRPSGGETGAPGGSLVTWRGGLKGERVRAAAEGRGHTMQEHDPRLKSRDLGWQHRAQEAFRQGRKTVCPPCWVLGFGRTVLVGQEQRKGAQVGR